MNKILIDAMGKECPIPVILTKKAYEQASGEVQIEVSVDNRVAVENLTRFGESIKGTVKVEEKGESSFSVIINAMGTGTEEAVEDKAASDICTASSGSGTVVAFDTNIMGRGDDKLGATLIKGFIYAISQLDELPKACVFYNGGALLAAEGSDSLSDLKSMEEAGVELIVCGTCADFYGIKEKLGVGKIGNMYDIVEKLSSASKVIRP